MAGEQLNVSATSPCMNRRVLRRFILAATLRSLDNRTTLLLEVRAVAAFVC
jgi:hypothetical protein